jgi:large subunit ribosomal protein L4e
MASRPLVTVQSVSGDSKGSSNLPAVFNAPIRPDIVQFVHTQMNKNRRQAYAVSLDAGHQHSAESWGTGRAVSRIPRVAGGGNSRSGQAAFGNMCRKGRMFNPTRVWRKWHRKINTNQKRFAMASAIAATRNTSLVLARGHRVSKVAELPLVVDDSLESISRTSAAYEALEALGASEDVDKARNSKKMRRGAGKMRGRRFVQRRGPLIIYKNDRGLCKAFRNLSGVDLCQVSRLNLLQLAPGGHLGRFVIWTQGAFDQLNAEWGSTDEASSVRKGYTLPQHLVSNADLARLINSDEVQSKVNPAQRRSLKARQKKNPLKNFGVRVRLNPYAQVLRRAELLNQQRKAEGKELKSEQSKRKARAEANKAHRKRQKLNFARLNDEGMDWPEEDAGAGDEDGDSGSGGGSRPAAEHAHPWSKYQSFDNDDCNGKKAGDIASLDFLGDAKYDPSKPSVVVFFAKYHKPGYKFVPKYNEIAEKYPDVQVIGAFIDPSKADVEKFATAEKYTKDYGAKFPLAHDDGKKVRDQFQAALMDTLSCVHAFLVDSNGTIVWHQNHSMVGATVPDYVDEMDQQIGQLVSGKPLFSYGAAPSESSSEEESEEESDEE